MSYGTQHLRNGWTLDIECARSTHRLRMAFQIAEHSAAAPTWKQHTVACKRHQDNLANVCFSYRDRVCCTCGRDANPIEWPEWVDDSVLQAIWNLAAAIQDKRGSYNRNLAREAKAEFETKEGAAK